MDICNYRKLHFKEIISILEEKDICSLGISSKTSLDITPMLFAFEYENENINFFLISSNTKIKDDLELVCIYLDNSISNFYRDSYQTVLAKGKPEIITNTPLKNHILSLFRKKYHKSLKDLISCSDLQFIKISIESITAKEYEYTF